MTSLPPVHPAVLRDDRATVPPDEHPGDRADGVTRVVVPGEVRPGDRACPGGERGQSTVEYALLLLGAAAIALVVVAWVTRTDLIGRLFDTVIGRILEQA